MSLCSSMFSFPLFHRGLSALYNLPSGLHWKVFKPGYELWWHCSGVIFSLMQSAKWVQSIECGGDECFIYILPFLIWWQIFILFFSLYLMVFKTGSWYFWGHVSILRVLGHRSLPVFVMSCLYLSWGLVLLTLNFSHMPLFSDSRPPTMYIYFYKIYNIILTWGHQYVLSMMRWRECGVERVEIRTKGVASIGRRAPQFVRFVFFMRNDAPTHCHGTWARDALTLLFLLPLLTLILTIIIPCNLFLMAKWLEHSSCIWLLEPPCRWKDSSVHAWHYLIFFFSLYLNE